MPRSARSAGSELRLSAANRRARFPDIAEERTRPVMTVRWRSTKAVRRKRHTGDVRQAKRFLMTIVGFGLLGLGALMVVLPGPGLLFVVAGLVVLATEYVWARRLLVRARKEAKRVQDAAVASRLRTAGSAAFAGPSAASVSSW